MILILYPCGILKPKFVLYCNCNNTTISLMEILRKSKLVKNIEKANIHISYHN
jgi:hypothetical protein